MDQELVQYLDSRFQSVNSQFQELRGEMTAEVQRLRGEMTEGFQGLRGEMTEGLQGLRGEMTAGLGEVKRHSGVLVEGLRHELQLVAEGFIMHIQVQHVQEREYHDRQHQETRALIRSIYDELRQRVENLEQKRQN
jgi:hypothetical protein